MLEKIQHIGSAWQGHGAFAVRLVQHLKPQITVDLGVDYGYSTFAFALPNSGNVFGIDLFDRLENHGNTFEGVQEEAQRLGLDNVFIMKGDFNDIAQDWQLAIDILHIDGAHEYASVKRDFDTWSKFMRSSGVILLHDTVSFKDDVGKLFEELELPKHNITHSYGLGIVAFDEKVLKEVVSLL
jgi:predicted O-methyltransferase YrrM